MAIVGKSAPWYTYHNEIVALFGKDPDVRIDMKSVNGHEEITLTVKGEKKRAAIRALLPEKKSFGIHDVLVFVNGDESKKPDPAKLIKDAFENNPVVSEIRTDSSSLTPPLGFTYLMFINKVVQFYDDRLDDPHGFVSTLYQTIAKDVLGELNGIAYCTAVPEKPAKPDPVNLVNTVKAKNSKVMTLEDWRKEVENICKTLKL